MSPQLQALRLVERPPHPARKRADLSPHAGRDVKPTGAAMGDESDNGEENRAAGYAFFTRL
jgi:hypothetical protein